MPADDVKKAIRKIHKRIDRVNRDGERKELAVVAKYAKKKKKSGGKKRPR